jgi:hypothetical protein
MSKDEQRAAVLRFYYENNEKQPGGYHATAAVSHSTGLDKAVVLEAQQYFVDKGFLTSGPRQQMRGEAGLLAIMARITDRGMDFVEHPTDWRGGDMPSALINLFVRDLNIAGRDQQVVGGDVSGSVAQGHATSTVAAFPIDQLRKLLADQPEALSTAEDINEEVSAPKPRWGRVIAALETFNSVVVAGEATHHVMQWVQQPGIPEFVKQAATAIFGT